jgi:hypothetical protein
MSYIAQTLNNIIKELQSNSVVEEHIKIWEICHKPQIDEFGRDFFNRTTDNNNEETNKVRTDAVCQVLKDYITEMITCKLCSLDTMQQYLIYSDKKYWCMYLFFTKTTIPVLLIASIHHIEKLDYISEEQAKYLIAIIAISISVLTNLPKLNNHYFIEYSSNAKIQGSNHVGILIGNTPVKSEEIAILPCKATIDSTNIQIQSNIQIHLINKCRAYVAKEMAIEFTEDDIKQTNDLQQELNKQINS